jgi:hypothetical protein
MPEASVIVDASLAVHFFSPRPLYLPLFTQVPRSGVLQTSPVRRSRKYAGTEFSELRGTRA